MKDNLVETPSVHFNEASRMDFVKVDATVVRCSVFSKTSEIQSLYNRYVDSKYSARVVFKEPL